MIDLTDVLEDEELGAETLQLIRLDQTVSARGRAVNVEAAPADFIGIVTQDAAQILERVPDGAFAAGAILVTTSTPLRMTSETSDADVIIWNGARYSVNKIGNYLRHGFNWAVCNPDGL